MVEEEKIKWFDLDIENNNILRDCFGVVTKEDIETCEKFIGITFPESYKTLMMACDGGFPKKDCFNYYSIPFTRYRGSCLGMFLLFSEDYPCPSELLIAQYKRPGEFFPEGLIAFGEVGNGDSICFDYRENKSNKNPPIVIWEHEGNPDNNVSYLAPDFESFMSMLKDDEEAETELEKLRKKEKEGGF
ncbi:MAG TPA: SMI1/KNR4 family protein [Alphaproteobacteria bacterium]|nr:SMI1/KNR4 family protein [Alphaproteobacteria bacterium]HQS94793.1 SMI1/KNR4 family protein [Alphaproteobacteria bacterium]